MNCTLTYKWQTSERLYHNGDWELEKGTSRRDAPMRATLLQGQCPPQEWRTLMRYGMCNEQHNGNPNDCSAATMTASENPRRVQARVMRSYGRCHQKSENVTEVETCTTRNGNPLVVEHLEPSQGRCLNEEKVFSMKICEALWNWKRGRFDALKRQHLCFHFLSPQSQLSFSLVQRCVTIKAVW